SRPPRARLSSFFYSSPAPRVLPSFPTRRSSDLVAADDPFAPASSAMRRARSEILQVVDESATCTVTVPLRGCRRALGTIVFDGRSEEHTSELQSLTNLVCRLLLEKKKTRTT